MIDVFGVTKFYGDFKAVDNLTFSIKNGEITGLLGPNGAGKTTTLRMLSCYLEPDFGSVEINGINTKESQIDIKKIIGYLPESAPLYGDMIVYDYLDYICKIRGIDGREQIPLVSQICRIKEVMHKNINELSKGYKQRVGLAQAIIHDPEVLILDEPTSGLDPIEIVEIRNLIKELAKKKRVILSTHILQEVEATCDRVIIINKGKIVADDTTANLLDSARGKKVITVKISGTPFEQASLALGAIDGIASVEKLEDVALTSMLVTVAGITDLRPVIFETVVKNGWVLYEMKQDHLSLENVFRELTAGENNEKI